jgi:ketose-bisphosphate aldolase
MALYTENEILSKAEEGKYAVGSFFALRMDWIKPIFEAAEEERSPIIISNTPELVGEMGFEGYSAALIASAQNARVPVCLHMDHGVTTDEKTLGHIMKFIRNGWSSVMYDASMKPLSENIRLTREVVKMCHAGEVTVLGAVGTVPRDVKEVKGYEVPRAGLTKPEEAKRFVEETEVDSLAIAIGQFVHPLTLGEPRPVQKSAKIDFELLREIRSVTDAHLVLHGGTHISDEAVKKAIELGVSEIKVAALQAIGWVDAIREYMKENPDDLMPSNILKPALLEVKKLTARYMRLFGSSGRAW